MQINIQGDCWINQFWNGEVEIHQYVGTDKEVVQTLDLSDYTESDLKLDYMMDGSDLLIPLQKGDYVIYYPTREFGEYPIMPGQQVTVGGVFYYADSLELSDYTVHYYFPVLSCTLRCRWMPYQSECYYFQLLYKSD